MDGGFAFAFNIFNSWVALTNQLGTIYKVKIMSLLWAVVPLYVRVTTDFVSEISMVVFLFLFFLKKDFNGGIMNNLETLGV